MEEGVPPLPPKPRSRPNPLDATAIVPYETSTYVVHFPKDQIFRVPPPENAHLAEHYRTQHKNRRKTPAFLSKLYYLLAVVLVLAIVCLVAALVFYLVVRPGVPTFSVEKIVATNSSRSKTGYDITMRAKNPSARMGFFCEKGGSADLYSKGKHVASGQPPVFSIGQDSATQIRLKLKGLNTVLPKEMAKSLKGSKEAIGLSLTADFPVRLGFGGIHSWLKILDVACDVTVSKLGKGTRIKSQKCEAKLR